MLALEFSLSSLARVPLLRVPLPTPSHPVAEMCVELGIRTVEAGGSQSEFKVSLGYVRLV